MGGAKSLPWPEMTNAEAFMRHWSSALSNQSKMPFYSLVIFFLLAVQWVGNRLTRELECMIWFLVYKIAFSVPWL